MAKILCSEDEIKRFPSNSFDEFKKEMDDMEEAYRWVTYPTKDALYIPLPDNPIYVNILRNEMPVSENPKDTRKVVVSEDVSNDTLCEKMQTTKACLSFPEDGKFTTYPVGETAIRGIYERVGLACVAMTSQVTNSRRQEASPYAKGLAYDALRGYSKGNTLLRIGDEQIIGCLSEEYKIISIPQAVECVKKSLEEKFEYVSFREGIISRETTSVDFVFEDYDLQRSVRYTLSKIGINIDFSLHVKIMTSDVGLSGCNLFTYISGDKGFILPIGLPLKMEHVGDASIEKLKKNTETIFESFVGQDELIDKMSSIKVDNPADAVYNIGKKAGIVEKILRDGSEEFDSEFPFSCKGTDVFFKLFEIYSKHSATGKYSDLALMQAMENITRACISNMSKFDMPVVKDGKVTGISAAA